MIRARMETVRLLPRRDMTDFTRRTIFTRIGYLTAAVQAGRLVGLRFGAERETGPDDPLVEELSRQLDAYFDGSRQAFDLPLRIEGTPFQEGVWQALRGIPYGETITYGELARRVEAPGASRAVGSANGRNPFPVIIPCHRVVAAGGKLGGYSGGGLDVKQMLLDHEAAVAGTRNQVVTLMRRKRALMNMKRP